VAIARRLAVNPANKAQKYILYSNGYIQPVGGALPVNQDEGSYGGSWTAGSSGAPISSSSDMFVSFQIYNWATPSGYTLDIYGSVWRWGGAPAIPGSTNMLTGGPEYYFGTNGGFPSPVYGYVIDFKMDPTGGGTCYLLLYNGEVVSVGTGVTVVQRSAFIPDTAARMLQMDWTSKRYWILDNLGRVGSYNGGTNQAVEGYTFPAYIWGRGGLYGQGGFRLYDFSTTEKGWAMDAFGRVYAIDGAQAAPGFNFTPNARQWVDMDIIDDGQGANPLRLVQLTSSGTLYEYVVSTPPSGAVIEPAGTLTTQTKPWVGWQYTDPEGDAQSAWQVKIITAAVYGAGGTVNEVQSLNQTGAPTGGNVVLGFRTTPTSPVATTATIANNASAATVQTALQALPNIGSGGVICTGGPWGTAPIVCTFSGPTMAGTDWPPIFISKNSFTGGSSPTIAITTTTNGSGGSFDPTTAASVFSASGTDSSTRVRSTVDLANSTTFRAYVRVTDTSGKQSTWSYSQFTTAYTVLNVPTVLPTPLGGPQGMFLRVSATTGAGLPGTARFAVQYQDAGSTVWYNVRNGSVLTPDGAGVATVADLDAPFNVARSYRAITYIYDAAADAWNGSGWSATASATNTGTWALTNPADVSQMLVPRLKTELSFERPTVGTVYTPVNRLDPVVLTDGAPKLPSFTLGIWALDRATRVELETMAASNAVLLLRTPFGENYYCRLIGSWKADLMHLSPVSGETTLIRDAREISLPMQAVKRPKVGPTTGPLAEV